MTPSKIHNKSVVPLLTLLFVLLILLMSSTFVVRAQTADELRQKINDRNESIRSLEAEIKDFQRQIDQVGEQANSLKNTLAGLDLSRRKLQADLKVTENKIEATNLEIKQLGLNISAKQNDITDDRTIIAQSLGKIYQSSSDSALEAMLRKQSLSLAFTSIDNLAYLQDSMKLRISELQAVKQGLETNKKLTEKKKAQLLDLTEQLKSQTKIIAQTTAEQSQLLAETKNTEANYKIALADKVAKKDAVEREVSEFESALRLIVDPNSIPHTGTGVLAWPLDSVKITQYFGNTPFATANPQIYNSKGHTGVDFRASIGTPVKAALSGTIVGVGNTDIVPTCYSYGKWIMIKHTNGLSTLYAHLSLQNVSEGQDVTTGQIIGYSGNTGYSTGPHLHFGVYATQGVRITRFENSKNCKNVILPLADPTAYLNPLSFL